MSRSVTPRRLRQAAGAASTGLVLIPFLAAGASAAGPFVPGGVVVYRVGAGATALSSASAPTFLDEYAPVPGTPNTPEASVALPTVDSGSATSDGEISLSADGTHLLAPGYVAAAGVASITSTTAASSPRAVDVVDGTGTVDEVTQLTGQYSANNIRSASSPDGTSVLYAAGTGTPGGVASAPVTNGAATPTQVTPSTGNIRQVEVVGGQVYYSSGSSSGPVGINQVAGAGSTTHLTGLDDGTGASPYGFALVAEGGSTTPDVAYVADSAAGVEKYVLSAGTWTADGTVTLAGVTGLVASVTAGVATIYATTPTTLVSITDTGGMGTLADGPLAAAVPTTVATAATNEAFRGVALAPTLSASPPSSLPEAPLAIGLPLAGVALVGGAWALNRRRQQD